MTQSETVIQIEPIIEAARTAPSGDNCQQWFFKWRDNRLEIYHDNVRGAHWLNRGNHASFLSLGCVVELIRLAASEQQCEIEVHYSLSAQTGAWCRIQFVPHACAPDALASAIGLRCTDRRVYLGGDVHAPVFAQIKQDLAQFSACRIDLVDTISNELMKYILQCELCVWKHDQAIIDFLTWFRASWKDRELSKDGMFWKNLGINWMASRTLNFLRHLPKAIHLLNYVGFGLTVKMVAQRQLRSAAGIMCFSVATSENEALVAVGRAAIRAWLRLNQSGYGVQPLTVMSLSVFDSKTNVLSADTKKEYVQLFERGASVLGEAFNLPEGALPVWAFRTGESRELPNDWKTLRLPLTYLLHEGSESR